MKILRVLITHDEIPKLNDATGFDVNTEKEWVAVLFNNEGNFVAELKDGSFWTVAYDEDEIFNKPEEAFEWLKERL